MPEWNPVAETFVNPYNFVSLGNIQREEPAEKLTKGDLTGVVKCTLKTVTPLAIPDSENKRPDERVKKHYIYPFFKVGNKAVVPGSEIRGMIRSVYEAATNSCMSVVNTNILSARHSFPRQPGLIRYDNASGNWELFQAKKYMLNTTRTHRSGTFYDIDKTTGKWHIVDGVNKFYTGSSVKFTPGGPYTKIIKDNAITIGTVVASLGGASTSNGYLFLWENIGSKHHNSVFQLTTTKVPCVNLAKAVENFREVCKIYEDNDEKYKKVTYELKKDGKYYPVWYETVSDGTNDHVYLSPACISRSVFDNRLEDLLGNHKKCTNIAAANGNPAKFKLCPACRLFGMIGEKSLGSSLRFSDAVLAENNSDVFLGYKTLKTLANPKISAVEFYTERPGANALTWSYDYKTTNYTVSGASVRPDREMVDTKIRGRKFYVHDLEVNENENKYKEKAKKEYNSTIELVKKDVSFGFEVYFENITDTQLKNLLWVLTYGENNIDGNMCHKLGHGKPIGLGSVKIIVDEINTRKVKITKNENGAIEDVKFVKKSKNVNALLPASINAPKELLEIANKNLTKDLNVSYPLANDNEGTINSQAAHQWFIGNKMMGELPSGGRAKYPQYSMEYVLPSISEIKIRQNMLHKHERLDPDAIEIWVEPPQPPPPGDQIENFPYPVPPPPPPPSIERDFTRNEINTARRDYKNPMKKDKKAQNKAILENFVNSVKETDPDYPEWKNLLADVRKDLRT